MKKLNFVSNLHNQTKRDYLERMTNNKVECMKKAKMYEFDYWDGDRKFGYGGYKYIKNRWKPVAQDLIKNMDSRMIQFLMLAVEKVFYCLKFIKYCKITIKGFDISNHGINHAKEEIRIFNIT